MKHWSAAGFVPHCNAPISVDGSLSSLSHDWLDIQCGTVPQQLGSQDPASSRSLTTDGDMHGVLDGHLSKANVCSKCLIGLENLYARCKMLLTNIGGFHHLSMPRDRRRPLLTKYRYSTGT